MNNDDYKVGFGNPPLGTRFKKGQSGNPRGRPPGSRNHKTILREIAHEKHAYREGGRKKKASLVELIIMTVRNEAAKGNPLALKLLDDIRNWFGTPHHEKKGSYLLVPADMPAEDWITEQRELNKYRKDPSIKDYLSD